MAKDREDEKPDHEGPLGKQDAAKAGQDATNLDVKDARLDDSEDLLDEEYSLSETRSQEVANENIHLGSARNDVEPGSAAEAGLILRGMGIPNRSLPAAKHRKREGRIPLKRRPQPPTTPRRTGAVFIRMSQLPTRPAPRMELSSREMARRSNLYHLTAERDL